MKKIKDSVQKESKLKEILRSFRITTDCIQVRELDHFDIYSIVPSRGIRSSRVFALVEDIGLQLKAYSTPKCWVSSSDGSIKIKIQKSEIKTPSASKLLNNLPKDMFCPILLGIDSYSNPVYFDLNKMPNLLVGGSTGSGKSVLLHNIILSIIESNSEVYLIDPKMVEFSAYKKLSSVFSVLHDYDDCLDVLDMIKMIMDDRFESLADSESRSVLEFNKKNPLNKMNPVVVVIDEWADIVLQDKAILKPLCSIAQKCRAAGISIVLATQRPSAKVISGLVKANFPGRIAMRVSSGVDSRVILDKGGAEKIKSVGEGIFSSPISAEDVVFRTPYIEDISSFIKERGYV